jgi:type IV secretion system protein VirB6
MAFIDALNTVFTDLDNVGTSVVQSLYTSVGTDLQPVFTVGVTVYIAYYGYEIVFGRATMAATDFVWRIVRIGVIYALAFTWGDFQTVAVNTLSQTADSLGGSICTAVAAQVQGGSSACISGSGGTGSESVIATALNAIWTSGSTTAQNITQAGGTFGVGLMILGLIVDILVALFVVEAMFMVVMGKLALYVLLGLAPIFIAMALFRFSFSLFNGWMRSCLTYAVVPLLTYGFIGFFTGLISAQQTTLNAAVSGNTVSMVNIAPFVIMCVLGALLMTQIPAIAAGIAGGTGFHHVSAVSVASGMLMRDVIRGGGGPPGAQTGARGVIGGVKSNIRTIGAVINAPNSWGRATGTSGGDAVAAQIAAGLKDNRK